MIGGSYILKVGNQSKPVEQSYNFHSGCFHTGAFLTQVGTHTVLDIVEGTGANQRESCDHSVVPGERCLLQGCRHTAVDLFTVGVIIAEVCFAIKSQSCSLKLPKHKLLSQRTHTRKGYTFIETALAIFKFGGLKSVGLRYYN